MSFSINVARNTGRRTFDNDIAWQHFFRVECDNSYSRSQVKEIVAELLLRFPRYPAPDFKVEVTEYSDTGTSCDAESFLNQKEG